MRLTCRLGFHRRDGDRAEKRGDHWRSTCRHCGRPVVRMRKGWWVPDFSSNRLSR